MSDNNNATQPPNSPVAMPFDALEVNPDVLPPAKGKRFSG